MICADFLMFTITSSRRFRLNSLACTLASTNKEVLNRTSPASRDPGATSMREEEDDEVSNFAEGLDPLVLPGTRLRALAPSFFRLAA